MKNLITLISLAFLLGNTVANAQFVKETTVKFDKNTVNAVVAEYKRPESVMEDALKVQLDKEDLGKSGKKKGYIVYSNTTWKRIGMYSLDVYFKVEGNKNRSTITVLVSKGYDNFVSPDVAPEIIDKVKEFLMGLESTATDVQFALDVEAQKEVVANAEKQYNRALSDSTNLLKERKKLENEIVQQSADVQAKRSLLDQHRQKLDGMKQ